MTIAKAGSTALLMAALALAGCAEKKPMLTLEVLNAAAKRCGATGIQIDKPADNAVPPSFSYLDPGPLAAGKATPVSNCLAEALSGHRFSSMTIRFEPPLRVGPQAK